MTGFELREQDWRSLRDVFERHLAKLERGDYLLRDKAGYESETLTEIWKQKLREDIAKYELLLAGLGEAQSA